MKYLFLFIAACSLMGCASQYRGDYQLVKVGEVQGRMWNDVWNNFDERPLKVFVGDSPDGSQRTIAIKIEGLVGNDYQEDFAFKKCTQKQIKQGLCDRDGFLFDGKGLRCQLTDCYTQQKYERLIYSLKKGIEWGDRAKKNKVKKLQKDITDENGDYIISPFLGGIMRYYVNGDLQQDLILPVSFPIGSLTYQNDVDIYYGLDEQKKLLKILTVDIYDGFKKSKQANKESELFD